MSDKIKVGQLRAFMEVYRLRKLNASAERLCVTPSAVTVLIRQLEGAVGTTLFDRTTRSLHPTAAAEEMLPIAQRILRDIDLLGSSFGGRAAPQGRLTVATTPTMASTLLPPVIKQFCDLYPQVRLALDDCPPDQFLSRIIGEQVDLGVGSPNEAPSQVAQRILLQDHLCAVCLPGHPLARLKVVRWKDLKGHPIVTIRPGYGIRDSINEAAAKASVVLNIQYEVALLTTALAMSAAGVAVTILPSYLIASAGYDNLVARKLNSPTVTRNIAVVTRRNRSLSVAGERMVELLQAHVQGQSSRANDP